MARRPDPVGPIVPSNVIRFGNNREASSYDEADCETCLTFLEEAAIETKSPFMLSC